MINVKYFQYKILQLFISSFTLKLNSKLTNVFNQTWWISFPGSIISDELLLSTMLPILENIAKPILRKLNWNIRALQDFVNRLKRNKLEQMKLYCTIMVDGLYFILIRNYSVQSSWFVFGVNYRDSMHSLSSRLTTNFEDLKSEGTIFLTFYKIPSKQFESCRKKRISFVSGISKIKTRS